MLNPGWWAVYMYTVTDEDFLDEMEFTILQSEIIHAFHISDASLY